MTWRVGHTKTAENHGNFDNQWRWWVAHATMSTTDDGAVMHESRRHEWTTRSETAWEECNAIWTTNGSTMPLGTRRTTTQWDPCGSKVARCRLRPDPRMSNDHEEAHDHETRNHVDRWWCGNAPWTKLLKVNVMIPWIYVMDGNNAATTMDEVTAHNLGSDEHGINVRAGGPSYETCSESTFQYNTHYENTV